MRHEYVSRISFPMKLAVAVSLALKLCGNSRFQRRRVAKVDGKKLARGEPL